MTSQGNYDAISVLLKETHDVLDIESLASIVQKLLKVAIVELLPIELLPAVAVHNVAIGDEPAKLVHSAVPLVHEEALLGLQQVG